MRVRSRFVLVGAVVAVTLAGVGVTHWRQGSARSGLRCEWRKDNAAAYRLKVSSSGTFHDGILSGGATGAAKQLSLRYEAELDLQAAPESGRSNAYVAKLRLSQGFENREASLREDLARPFAFEMDESCRFGEFGFSSEESRESRELKKSLLIVLEAIAQPRTVAATTWQVKQTDAAGEYEASYRLDPETSQIMRSRLYYSKTNSLSETIPLKAEISKSAASFIPAEEFWLAKATVQESMRIVSEKGQPFVQSSAHASLEEMDGKKVMDVGALAAVAHMKWEGIRVDEANELTSSNYDNVGGKSLAAVTGTLSEALDAFVKGDFYSGKIDRQAVGDMVHFLRANPAAIQELLDKVKAGQVDEQLHAFLFFTLTKVGTPDAQRALITTMRDAGHTEGNRMQAMHALADVDKPLPESIEALIGMAQTFSTEPNGENELESTALLALGIVERRQMEGNEKELAKRASDVLLDKIKGDVSEQERTTLVEAIGNTGNPQHSRVIIDQFNDDSSAVRVSAARALSRMAPPNADQALLDAVGRETVTDTRKEIADAWANKLGQAGAFDTGKLTEMLTREPNESIRLSMIAVLGREAESQPAVRAALVRQYAKETSPKVKYSIGRYLKADELL